MPCCSFREFWSTNGCSGGGDDTPQTKLGCICHAFGGLPFDFNSSSSCHRMLY